MANAFLLKADINKAFDTIQWPFLIAALKVINFPKQLIHIIMNCIRDSKVTILINGEGDGFIKPTRGLRQ